MSRSHKAAKSAIRDCNSLLHSLVDMMKTDFKKNLTSLEETLNQLLFDAENAILESSKAREAMIAGVGSMKKSVEKGQRKFTKNNNLDELRATLTEVNSGINRLRVANDKISDGISLILNPNISAVEAVEKFASDLQRFAGTWERIAREIDQSVIDLCDDQEPSELIELERYILEHGFDKLVNFDSKKKESE